MSVVAKSVESLESEVERLRDLYTSELETEIRNASGRSIRVQLGMVPASRDTAYLWVGYTVHEIGVIFPFQKKVYCLLEKRDRTRPLSEKDEIDITNIHNEIARLFERKGYKVLYGNHVPSDAKTLLKETWAGS